MPTEDVQPPDETLTQPKPPYKPTKMVICGGGVKGRAYAPVIKALHETEILPGVTDVYGSSIGAILSGMLSLGFSPKEIQAQLDSDLSPYQDAAKCHSPKTPKLLTKVGRNLLKDGAVFKGEKLAADAQAIVNQAGLDPNATFADLQAKVDKQERSPSEMPYRNLHITATVVDKRGSYQIILNSKTAPDMPIALAMRASAALPPAFRAVVITPKQMEEFTKRATEPLVKYDRGPAYHNEEGIDERKVDMGTKIKLIDGGLVDNLPQYVVQTDSNPNDDILSLNLRDPNYMNQKERYKDTLLDPNNREMCNKLEMQYLAEREASMGIAERAYKNPHKICYPPSRLLATRDNTLDIPTYGVQAADFEMDDVTHQKLLQDGHDAILQMLKSKNVDTNRITPAPEIERPNAKQQVADLIAHAKTELVALGLENSSLKEVAKIADLTRNATRNPGSSPDQAVETIKNAAGSFNEINKTSNNLMSALKRIDAQLLDSSLSKDDKDKLKEQKKELLDLNSKFTVIVKIFRYEQIESKSKLGGVNLAREMAKGLCNEFRTSAEVKVGSVANDAQKLVGKLKSTEFVNDSSTKIQEQIKEINGALKLLKNFNLPNKNELKATLNDIKGHLFTQKQKFKDGANQESSHQFIPAKLPEKRPVSFTPQINEHHKQSKIGEHRDKSKSVEQDQTVKPTIGKHRS